MRRALVPYPLLNSQQVNIRFISQVIRLLLLRVYLDTLIESQEVWGLQAMNFYSFYIYRTALSKTLAATQTTLGGLDRFVAGAMAGVSLRTLLKAGDGKMNFTSCCEVFLRLSWSSQKLRILANRASRTFS